MIPSDLGLSGDVHFHQNLRVLTTDLKKNQVIKIKDGHLKIKKLNVLNKILFRFTKNKNEKQVREVINGFVKQLDYSKINSIKKINKQIAVLERKIEELDTQLDGASRLDKLMIRSEQGNLQTNIDKLRKEEVILKEKEEKLRTLLFDHMAHLKYDRAQLPKSAVKRLDPTLKEKKIAKRKAQIAHADAKGKKREVLEGKVARKELEEKIAKAKFAEKLGVRLKPIGKGMSGSYFVLDYKGNILGVFKPASEESLTGSSPKLKDRVKRGAIKLLPINDPAALFHANKGYKAEVLTSALASHLRFHTVPASTVARFSTERLKDAKGSFQVFAPNTKSAEETLLPATEETMKMISQEQFEEMVVIDFLTYNRDRHFENWLISAIPNADGTRNIYLIDHGLSMPKENPGERDRLFYSRNQFKWASLPMAEETFSDEMKAKLERRLTKKEAKLFQTLRNTSKRFDKGEKSQETAFKQRLDVLKKFLSENRTMEELALVKTQEDIDKVLKAKTKEELDIVLNAFRERWL